MGVTGLWPILAPSARPTPLPTLNRKRLAVDASIWIYQFLKAVRDKEGNALRNSHVVGFFRRICKLLFFGIKPVFVFDGGAPVLKRQTIQGRKRRREGRREDAVRTAGKLLAVQMKRRGEEEEEKRKKDKQREKAGLPIHRDDDEEPIPEDLVYVGEMGMSAQERNQNRKFRKTDAYHLPELTNGIEGMGQPNDPRVMSVEELEEYARQFNSGEDVNLYDFSKIDFDGEFFRSLPAGDRYNILNAARLRSRLRMGLSKEQLEEMFPDRMAFSRFQIERVRERNELTQRLMNLNGMNADMAGVGVGRIAGERGREYVLVKNDGVEGGWALGVVSMDKSTGDRNKPIDVDALHPKPKEKEESEDDDEFEDVPVEGLNRLPKAKPDSRHNFTYADFQAKELVDQRKKFYASRQTEGTRYASTPPEELDSLFVEQDSMEGPSNNNRVVYDEEQEDLDRAIALSLQKDVEGTESDEEEHLNKAIALSMQKNHPEEPESEENLDFEDIPVPTYEQKAVEPTKPLTKTSGGMIAHIVNNRANAAVPKRKEPSMDSDSDSDMDLQSALAKARKQKAPETRMRPAPVISNRNNLFDGPLPFEKLGSIFGNKGKGVEKPIPTQGSANLLDDMAGGFDATIEEEEGPRPIPPWLMNSNDIRIQVEEQKKKDRALNAADREYVHEEERLLRKRDGPIQIDSSDDEDDVKIVDAPLLSQKVTKPGKIAEDAKAMSPVLDILQDREPSIRPAANEKDKLEIPVNAEEEEVEWSESDYGDVVMNSTKAADAGHHATKETAKTPSKLSSPNLEDTTVPNANGNSSAPFGIDAPKSPDMDFEDIEMPDNTTTFPSESPFTSEGPRLPVDDDFERQMDEEFGDLSDPEEEELLAQLAIEAEEHARFASTLNNKSAAQNQEEYEKELKTLRAQQKKDRRDADEVSHIMVTECQALLRLFGIPYITAPMEAEAQCAELVRLGLVDGVVTDDCDIFLFGGTRVYKNMFNSNKYVECYLSGDIEKELSLSRDQLIAIAHLLGSDYTEGLPGVGPVTAVEILSDFPNANGLEEFREWWNSVQLNPQAMVAEKSTFRKKFRRSQATKLFLPPAFPSAAVTEAYLKPEVDSTPEHFQWGVPDLDQLREFLMATIGWSHERTDEVLVPVIRDMNRREQEGTQSNITRFFEGAVGVGAMGVGNHHKEGGSKRMREAVGRLKARKHGGGDNPLGKTFADEAAEWARNNDLSWTEREQEKMYGKKGGKGKGKAKGRGKSKAAQILEQVDEDENGEASSVAGQGGENIPEAQSGKGKAKAKSKSKGKRKATAILEQTGEDEDVETGSAATSGKDTPRPDDVEADDESGSADEYRDTTSKSKGKGNARGKSTAKRKRVKI